MALLTTAKLSFGYQNQPDLDATYTEVDHNHELAANSPVAIDDITQTSTGWSYQTTADFTLQSNAVSATPTTTHFSNAALDQAYKVSTTASTFDITGLDDTKEYDFYFAFSRTGNNGSLGYETTYSISGTDVVLNNENEGTDEVSILGATSTSGVISVSVQATGTATSGFMAAIQIEEHSIEAGTSGTSGQAIANTGWTQTGAVVRAKSQVVRKGGTVTFTADDATGDNYSWTIYGAGSGGSNVTSGDQVTNSWTSPALDEYGNFNVLLTTTKDGVEYKNFQERIVNVRPAYTKGSQSNSYTHNISSNITINAANIATWGLSTSSPITIILTGTGAASYYKINVDYVGTEAAPLLIINDGTVTFTGTANKAIHLSDASEWVFIDGFGEDENITATGGAPSPSNINPKGYGIVFDTTGTNWNIYAAGNAPCKNIYMYGITCRGGGGLAQIKPYAPSADSDIANLTPYNYENIYFHHYYLYDCVNEGFYLGETSNQAISNYRNGTSNSVGFESSAIYRGDAHHIGKDIFQARFCSTADFDIHDNVCTYGAAKNQTWQNSLFALNDGFGGRIFNNLFDFAGNDVTNSCKSWYPTYIYNNIFLNLGNGETMTPDAGQEGAEAANLFYSNTWDHTSSQVFDPNFSIEYYIYNNLFHTQSLTGNILIEISTEEAGAAFIEYKFYNNATISPTDSPTLASTTISNATNVSQTHLDQAGTSGFDFVGGAYNGGTGIFEIVGVFDDNGDYSVPSSYLLSTSPLFDVGTDISAVMSDAPNSGAFPAHGVWTDYDGTVGGTTWHIGPYYPSDTVADTTPIAIIIADKTTVGLYETIALDGSQSVNTTGYSWDFGTTNYTITSGSTTSETVEFYYTAIGDYTITLTASDDDLNTNDGTADVEVNVQSPNDVTPIYYKIYSTTSSRWLYGIENDKASISTSVAPDGSGDTVVAESVTIISAFDETADLKKLGTFATNNAARTYLKTGDLYWDFLGNLKRVI